nr:3465_t:CDS:2 [Entrophospora candida]
MVPIDRHARDFLSPHLQSHNRIYREETPEYGGYGYLINMNSVEFSIQEVNKYGEIKKIEEKLNKLRI